MLQNTKVAAFTVSELLRENQQGGGYPLSWLELTLKQAIMVIQVFKGYLCNKTILSLKFFVSFSRYLDFRVFVKSTDSKSVRSS